MIRILRCGCIVWSFIFCASLGSRDFYVDPAWKGQGNGSSNSPWSQLDEAAWHEINAALKSQDVTVFFSARRADEEVCQVYPQRLLLDRADGTAHVLTLDGRSKFNQDDRNPLWTANSGKTLCILPQIHTNNDRHPPFSRRYNLIVKGFAVRILSGQALHISSCWNCVFEDLDISHLEGSRTGPNIMIDGPVESEEMASRGITFRNNYIHHSYGELLYINGPKQKASQGGARYGATDILVERNLFKSPSYFGGEADGIDVKDGIRNLTIRNNLFEGGERGQFQKPGFAITTQSGTGLRIEGNVIRGWTMGGINLGIASSALPNRSGTVIKDNFIDNNGGDGANAEFGIYIRARDNVKGKHAGNPSKVVNDPNTNFFHKRTFGRSGVTPGFRIRNNQTGQSGKVIKTLGENQVETDIIWNKGDEWEILFDNWTHVELIGNIISRQRRSAGNDGGGIIVHPQATDIRIIGNKIISNTGTGLTILPGGQPVTLHEHNLYFNQDPASVLVSAGGKSFNARAVKNFEPSASTEDPGPLDSIAKPFVIDSQTLPPAECSEEAVKPLSEGRFRGRPARERSPR